MKKYLRNSKYVNVDGVVVDDHITIDVDVNIPEAISASSGIISRFPGMIQFKQDVLDMLETEYGFEVIQDVYDGVLQKGYITNRPDGTSVYFDTYFDLSRSGDALKRLNIESDDIPNTGVAYCFIHIRFSDHNLYDDGDLAHRKFIWKNAQSRTSQKQNVVYSDPEAKITLTEKDMYGPYQEALNQLRYELDHKIFYWIGKAKIALGITNWKDYK